MPASSAHVFVCVCLENEQKKKNVKVCASVSVMKTARLKTAEANIEKNEGKKKNFGAVEDL